MIWRMRITRKHIRIFFHETLLDYFLELAHYAWVVFFTAIMSFAGAIIDMGDFDVPVWVWWSLVILSIFVIQFLAWMRMKNERDKHKKADIDNVILAKISGQRDEVVEMLNKPTKDESELGVLRYRYEEWRKKTRDYLNDNITEGEAGIFYRMGTFSWMGMPTTENFEELKARSMMAHDAAHLKQLVSDYSRAKPRDELIRAAEEEGS